MTYTTSPGGTLALFYWDKLGQITINAHKLGKFHAFSLLFRIPVACRKWWLSVFCMVFFVSTCSPSACCWLPSGVSGRGIDAGAGRACVCTVVAIQIETGPA